MSDWWAIDWFSQEWFGQEWFAGEQAEGAMSATLSGAGGASGSLTAVAWMSATIGGAGTISGAMTGSSVGAPVDAGGGGRRWRRVDRSAPTARHDRPAPLFPERPRPSPPRTDPTAPGRHDRTPRNVALALAMLDDWE